MERGYTKHYFEENKRVCSNIGGGFRDAGYDIMEPIGLITPFEDQWSNAKDGIFKTFEQCIKSPVDLENTKDKIVNVMKDHEKDRNEEEYQFYYTNDHLGSSTYITDQDGNITQTLAYLPYGEDWVDLDNHPPYITPYKFNGKEKDEETGYNNYGARYYYDWASIWLSVDPNSDNYPHATSYAYCNNNPIMLIDPDGKDWYYTEDGKCLGQDKAKTNYVWSVPDGGYRDNPKGKGFLISKGNRLNDNAGNPIDHNEFVQQAATVYGESSVGYGEVNKEEMFAIASVHQKNNIAYGSNNEQAQLFKNTPDRERDGGMQVALGAVINALSGGKDYSNGATHWDGREQAMYSGSDNRKSTGKFELHMNTWGWNIKEEHYNTWKNNIGSSFKAPQIKTATVGINKGKVRATSTAVHGKTIFWQVR